MNVSALHFLGLSNACIFAVPAIYLASTGPAWAEAYFQGLGHLPGMRFSEAVDVSDDGSIIAGSDIDEFGTIYGFQWTSEIGPQPLGGLPGKSSAGSFPARMSADGSMIVGRAVDEAFRWMLTGGMSGLGDFPGGDYNRAANDVSADGSVIVGFGTSDIGREAFRWTEGAGIVGIGDLPGGLFKSTAIGISADSSTVVGWSESSLGSEAFRWTQASGMVGLGDLPGGEFISIARAVSIDGAVIVGSSWSTSGEEAFRWTQETGMVGLGDLPGGQFESGAFAVSADGSVVIGYGKTISTGSDDFGHEAFIWDVAHGMRSLKEVLQGEFGFDLSGWRLWYAQGISLDGQTIVGVGKNPTGQQEGWVAHVGPTSITGDYNQNGVVDAADYVVWRDSVGQVGEALVADGDGSGAVDTGDYEVWRAHFGQNAAGSSASFRAVSAVVPEPSTVALAAQPAAFLFTLVGFSRRHRRASRYALKEER